MSRQRVFVPIVYNESLEYSQIREVCAGLEEEGVPFRLYSDPVNLVSELGEKAATHSPLQVGIGIDSHGNICIHHEKLKHSVPYLSNHLDHGRNIGKNAARMVKGTKLSLLN